MAKRSKSNNNGNGNGNGSNLGFEEKLWLAADKLRGSLDAAEYKHVVLGLIFLKYISDAFEERRAELTLLCNDLKSDHYTDDPEQQQATLEDRDEYLSANVFWVPEEARWPKLQDNAKQATIGTLIDDAMDAIERENPRLKAVLPKRYARPDLDKTRLGQLIDLVGTITVGDKESRSKDILGRVYEYFLGKFASAEGKLGGEFFTPRSVVQLLVEMLEPYKGRVYDPCCGSGGMFVQSEKFVLAHGGRLGDISIYGQEMNATTWRLCHMNLAIRGIEAHLGSEWADTFRNDLHKDLRADFLLANPPFNISDWNGELLREDGRWKYGVPPVGNANYAWIQHGYWSLPGGGMEASDSGDFRACAARELFEETVGVAKLEELQARFEQRLAASPEHRVRWPFCFDYRTYLLPLAMIPNPRVWPNGRNWNGEFEQFGWFELDRLPHPMHPFVRETLESFVPST